VPLLFLGLDDTLLDRAGAFEGWAAAFLGKVGAPEYDLDWLRSVDADGLASFWDVAEALRDRYRLRAPAIDLMEDVRDGVLERLYLDPLVACALGIAENAGWRPVIVTNGPAALQEAKLRRTGLDRHVAGWVISEEAGVRKPNPRIFAIAADRARMRMNGAWIVGDSPEADIGGAATLGLPSVWLRRGRPWQQARYEPTRSADGPIEALAVVMEQR
jgi:putative hydrolase of the HAD superfamily